MSVLYVCISIPALLLSSSVLFFKDKEVVAQLCPTPCDPLDCNPPGSSVHGIFQARILEWVAIFLLQGIFLIKGLNPCLICLLHWRQILYQLSHWGSPAWPRWVGWGGRWGESSRGKGHMYTYGGFTFMYGRKQHNIIIILELKINKKYVIYIIYNGILQGHRKEQSWFICSDMDGPRVCHTEWSKSEREKQILYIMFNWLILIFNKKTLFINAWEYKSYLLFLVSVRYYL